MGLAKEKVAEEGISARVVSPLGDGVEADSRLKEMVSRSYAGVEPRLLY